MYEFIVSVPWWVWCTLGVLGILVFLGSVCQSAQSVLDGERMT